ncbi:ATP synthase subunit s, mitochondrial isoform X1 [Bacillus rossius redtenbacheri]|uniref:ATP synthase subunit s, mitochondrial isoform X1 n=1 Tax=Bacillus rossius redtenbacheri TaxID=93214 RepID=UPI002FDE643B
MIVVYLKMKLLKIGLINRLPKRNLWNFLTIVWNRVDHSRVKEVGPDRACAEWLLRNGACVKWENDKEFLKDYNLLPPEQVRRHIVAVDASEASISSIGFPYFKGCSRVGSVSLDKCPYIDDEALRRLHYLGASLRHLSVSRCGGVAEPGILSLAQLGWVTPSLHQTLVPGRMLSLGRGHDVHVSSWTIVNRNVIRDSFQDCSNLLEHITFDKEQDVWQRSTYTKQFKD